MSADAKPQLCLFGHLRVVGEDKIIDSFATRRSALLLARLGVARDHAMSRSDLADVLWPEDYYDATRLRLRQELARLRRSLDNMAHILVTDADKVRLDTSAVDVDLDELDRAVRRARGESAGLDRQAFIDRAIEMSRSPLLIGLEGDWIEAERMSVSSRRCSLMVDLGKAYLDAGKLPEALSVARESILMEPTREQAHLLAIEVLGEMGHLADLLNQFQSLRRMLGADSGRKLSPEAELLMAKYLKPGSSPSAEVSAGLTFEYHEPTEPIFGRDRELALITKYLDPSSGTTRLLSVLGMGGIGKTHLALHATSLLRELYGGRVAFVGLSAQTDASLTPLAIQKAIGLMEISVDDPVARIIRCLPAEPTLIVLDNLEQFGPAIGPIVKRLLEGRPSVRVLVTSRTPLRIAGESRMAIGPLAVPAPNAPSPDEEAGAMKMFVHAVQSARLNRPIRDEERKTMESVVRRLEGVPLGLSLAAPQVAMFGATEVLRSLAGGIGSLQSRQQDTPARHRTLRNAIIGSFEATEEFLRRTVRDLSVFRGGWTLEAARTVCGIVDPAGVMERLLEASLIQVASEGERMRFRMLEPIREYAWQQNDRAQQESLRRSHLRWAIRLSAPASPLIVDAAVLQELQLLEPEYDNMWQALLFAMDSDPDAAFELSSNLGSFWLYGCYGFEALRYLRDLFARYKDLPPSSGMLRASFTQARLSHLLESKPEGDVVAQRTIDLGRLIGDRRHEPEVLTYQALHSHYAVRIDECLRYIEEAERFAQEHGAFEAEGAMERCRGYYEFYEGNYEAARSHFLRSLRWFEDRGELIYSKRVRIHLAIIAVDLRDLSATESLLKGIRDGVDRVRFALTLPWIAHGQGRAALLAGRYAEAHTYFQEAEALWRDRQIWWGATYQNYFRAQTCFEQGDYLGAIDFVVTAIKGWQQAAAPFAVGVAMVFQACALARIGSTRTAARLYRAGRAVCVQMGDHLIPSDLHFVSVGEKMLAEELANSVEPVLSYDEAFQVATEWTVDGMELSIAEYLTVRSLTESSSARPA